MEHRKCYHAQIIPYEDRVIVVEGPVKPELLSTWDMHPNLNAFRRPKEQQEALIEIAGLPEGRIIVSRDGQTIVGYVTFHYPDELERWSEGGMEDLIELGAIEVANEYRSLGLGKKMITTAFEDDQMESYIVFTTEYYWHWDLEGTRLNVWDYRKMMERLMESVDMVWYATDDPEICSHPANCLMVRIGKDVPLASRQQFDRVRFRQRFMY
ncbi:GNAT family N-acetyltransferase [Paenibacillus melissococcoides]|uniref:GNAT family N-acetyltransferase n=1 Tax=Paenibacillus melissococcoides TaxID=2912268 RepID=A0ABN8U819_9BACL|nr:MULTISPECIES: GNAT family N-acetyltransferase [Paenibacillus]MEB9896111.1 GNAT family N-acetyltransferase [Bacillus cereus]CAH8247264.1 GNAT family N-acetyltransferase [Paenibacillus melissococcoides]CAH8717193.1 GNAT family N-acetyltransferase [Paenibacillus melissococcoides]CAH8718181.1 GNAT family N-acetyltransferase [Paenibacillus melissococcoides]GIO82197.1 acetoin utilization protein AcuA [Paenibacillus dendritiformis]